MEDQDYVTSFVSSTPGFTDTEEESADNLDGGEAWRQITNTNNHRLSTNYGSEIGYSEILAAGLLSSQEPRASPRQVPTVPIDFSDCSDFDPEDDKIIDALVKAIQNEEKEDSFAKEAAIQGSVEENAPLAKIPKPLSSQASARSANTHHSSIDPELWNSKVPESKDEKQSHYLFPKASNETEAPNAAPVQEEKVVTAEPEAKPEDDANASKAAKEDQEPPITRFRKYRPLAVSDFVAPAWCELQYFYSLSKYGRIRRTAVMKKGSEVHKTLELEVHEYVPIKVLTKEDSWGLRIWNVIQGLRALRVTGVTRELDVWGVVNGEVVSGIIDEISTECPDPELEEALTASVETFEPSPHQRTITEFFGDRTLDNKRGVRPKTKYYLSDTKTRNTPTLPNDASLKQVKVQLMLYHHIVTLLSENQVQSKSIFKRYNLRPEVEFSVTFLEEIAGLESDIRENFGASADADPGEDTTEPRYTGPRDLGSLWKLMASEFQETFKHGSLMPLVSASFRYQADGTNLGSKAFVNDPEHLSSYVGNVLDWWRGAREARGVEIEEAWKCRTCEFAEGCEWRMRKEEEAKSKRWKRGVPKRW